MDRRPGQINLRDLFQRGSPRRKRELCGSSHGQQYTREQQAFISWRLSATLIPDPTDSGLPTDQKCMKNKRGCSVSMWLCSAVTEISCPCSSEITGLTSSAVSTKSPVVATLPDSAA